MELLRDWLSVTLAGCSLPFAARLTNYSNSRVTFYGSHLRNYLLFVFDALPGAYP